MSLRTASLVAALVSLLALAPVAAAARPTTTEPASLRLVTVTLTDTKGTFAKTRLERGTIVQFTIRNRSKVARVLVVGTARSKAVKPGKSGTLLVHMDLRGKLTWRSVAGGKATYRGSLLVV
jgi:hypothetical protein